MPSTQTSVTNAAQISRRAEKERKRFLPPGVTREGKGALQGKRFNVMSNEKNVGILRFFHGTFSDAISDTVQKNETISAKTTDFVKATITQKND